MWVLFSLLAALAGAVLATLTKAGLKNVDPSLGLAIQSVLILVLSWGTVAVQGNLEELRAVDRRAWVYLVLAGVVTSASYLLLFRALKLGEASRVVPVDRLSLVFAILLGAVFLKEKIGTQVILGAVVMTAGALLIATAKA
jgi:bacterial/archaeal transporter family protein